MAGGSRIRLLADFHMSVPTTLEEAFDALDKMLSDEDKEYLQKNPDEAPIRLHHSLGRHLRNEWGLWSDSVLKTHLMEVHGIKHPDDMSGFILDEYARCRYPTRYDRLRGQTELVTMIDDKSWPDE